MKYHWVDYDTLSIRQIKLPFSSLENVDDEFKWTFQAIKCRINEISSIVFSYTDQKKMWKEPFFFFFLLMVFKTTPKADGRVLHVINTLLKKKAALSVKDTWGGAIFPALT